MFTLSLSPFLSWLGSQVGDGGDGDVGGDRGPSNSGEKGKKWHEELVEAAVALLSMLPPNVHLRECD